MANFRDEMIERIKREWGHLIDDPEKFEGTDDELEELLKRSRNRIREIEERKEEHLKKFEEGMKAFGELIQGVGELAAVLEEFEDALTLLNDSLARLDLALKIRKNDGEFPKTPTTIH